MKISKSNMHNGHAESSSASSFPWVLYDMLNNAEVGGYKPIVQWQPHGRAFIVHDVDLFVSRIMPLYFNQSKYKSFQRQLSLYGFKRLTCGLDQGAYFHPSFVRSQRPNCSKVTRKSAAEVRELYNGKEEPNFYASPWAPNAENSNIGLYVQSRAPRVAPAKSQRQPPFVKESTIPCTAVAPKSLFQHSIRKVSTEDMSDLPKAATSNPASSNSGPVPSLTASNNLALPVTTTSLSFPFLTLSSDSTCPGASDCDTASRINWNATGFESSNSDKAPCGGKDSLSDSNCFNELSFPIPRDWEAILVPDPIKTSDFKSQRRLSDMFSGTSLFAFGDPI